jgi:hypothetical protein
MSDTIPSEPENRIEQEDSPAPTTPEAQPENAQEPSSPAAGLGEPERAVRRSRRGVVSLIFGIASIVLALLTLLPGPIAWVGYLGLVATLIALLSARGILRKQGEADRRERQQAQAGVATGLLGFAVLAVLFVVGTIQAAQRSTALLTEAMAPPKTFESADFILSYPGSWKAADTTQMAECKNPAMECLLWLDAPLGDGRLLLFRFPKPGVETAEEFDQAFWTAAQNSGAELVSQQNIQIDQRPAIQRIFRLPASDDPSRRVCTLLITTASDGTIYQFKGVAGDSAACDGHRATFDSITQSFDFKGPLAAPAAQTATITPPRPTAKPKATPTSAPKSAPAADLSAAKITLEDLPATFGEFPQPDVAKELEDKMAQAFTQSSMSAELANFSAYAAADAENPQVFMSFVIYPLDKDSAASFAEAMGQSDLMLQSIAGGITSQTGKARVEPLKGSDQLGDKSIGGTLIGDKMQVDVIIMRRGAALAFVMLYYNTTAKPGADVVQLAHTLDQRLQDALK